MNKIEQNLQRQMAADVMATHELSQRRVRGLIGIGLTLMKSPKVPSDGRFFLTQESGR